MAESDEQAREIVMAALLQKAEAAREAGRADEHRLYCEQISEALVQGPLLPGAAPVIRVEGRIGAVGGGGGSGGGDGRDTAATTAGGAAPAGGSGGADFGLMQKPKDLGDGVLDGLATLGKGVGAGVAVLVAAPVAGAVHEGKRLYGCPVAAAP